MPEVKGRFPPELALDSLLDWDQLDDHVDEAEPELTAALQ